FKHRIREITGRSRGISMERRLGELRTYVRGWMGYFGLASQLKLFASLEQWIRRRIRCCYWKRWRRVRTRVRVLIALGVPRRQAIPTRQESQRTLAHVQDDRKRRGNDECLVSRTRSLESEDVMGRACSSSLNRRMRTRMSEWCGEGGQR
ncbi:MAG: group II intron maturase-specific domain-containing protein, partial [Pirellulaceae bacterium]|nr:group II intron maturase-specific domain-containing protein [Pirellulaceae bacterium]